MHFPITNESILLDSISYLIESKALERSSKAFEANSLLSILGHTVFVKKIRASYAEKELLKLNRLGDKVLVSFICEYNWLLKIPFSKTVESALLAEIG